jgi:hypothetical protein
MTDTRSDDADQHLVVSGLIQFQFLNLEIPPGLKDDGRFDLHMSLPV